MKRLDDDSGQVAIVTVLCMTCLLGFVAFAVDVGLLLRAKRVAQTAADSAVMAAAAEFNYGDMTAAATADAVQNGVPASAVVVNKPPLYGPNVGKGSYVEVIISQSQPTFFMKMFSRNSMMVGARAVATTVPTPSCVDTVQSSPPSGIGLDMSGGANLDLPTCGVEVGATGAGAFTAGGGITLTATAIGVAGGTSIHNGAQLTPSTPTTGITVTDPLLPIVTPPPASEYTSGCLTDPNIKTGTSTIGPASATGFVCYNGLTISRSPTVTLNPGLYIINGNGASADALSISGAAVVNGSGVSFYFVNNGSFTISNGAALTLSAPTASTTSVGLNSGLLFYQQSTDTAADSFVGGSSGSLNGIFYLPSANLTFANGNASTFSTDLVVGSLTMSGAATIRPYAPLSGASPLSSPRLAE